MIENQPKMFFNIEFIFRQWNFFNQKKKVVIIKKVVKKDSFTIIFLVQQKDFL